MVAAQRLAFSRGLAEKHVVDRDNSEQTSHLKIATARPSDWNAVFGRNQPW
jgi:hypothetical protein